MIEGMYVMEGVEGVEGMDGMERVDGNLYWGMVVIDRMGGVSLMIQCYCAFLNVWSYI